MRDKANYRAANGRAQDGHKPLIPPSFACLRRAAKLPSGTSCPPAGLPGASILPRDHVHGRVDDAGHEWIGIHTNGIDTRPLE